jgi:hypothetical protein
MSPPMIGTPQGCQDPHGRRVGGTPSGCGYMVVGRYPVVSLRSTTGYRYGNPPGSSTWDSHSGRNSKQLSHSAVSSRRGSRRIDPPRAPCSFSSFIVHRSSFIVHPSLPQLHKKEIAPFTGYGELNRAVLRRVREPTGDKDLPLPGYRHPQRNVVSVAPSAA